MISFLFSTSVLPHIVIGLFFQEEYFHVRTSLLPMVVPPRPWVSSDAGGYIITPSKLFGNKIANSICYRDSFRQIY